MRIRVCVTVEVQNQLRGYRGGLHLASMRAVRQAMGHLHTYRAMGPGSWMHGSAPAEKHIELTVDLRFERRGMRWSRNGARRLLAIRP